MDLLIWLQHIFDTYPWFWPVSMGVCFVLIALVLYSITKQKIVFYLYPVYYGAFMFCWYVMKPLLGL